MKSCIYTTRTGLNLYSFTLCQVARKNMEDHSADMTKKTAKNVVKTIFQSPSPVIKIEFQGGDPSTDLTWLSISLKKPSGRIFLKKRELDFVICTNLTLLNEDMVKYLKKHKCMISTSLDGPKDLHDMNRPLQNKELDHHAILKGISL